jgi:hypothetical protein
MSHKHQKHKINFEKKIKITIIKIEYFKTFFFVIFALF